MFGVDNSNVQSTGGAMPAPAPAAYAAAEPNPISGHPVEGSTSMPMPATGTVSVPEPANDLLALKQQALNSLQPMVGKLNQSPEEKFKTLMMLIQASDNSSLVKDAYAVALQITDEQAQAQALIDIVNEINYFTQAKA